MASLKHPPPNFVVNAVKGWNTRLLYAYYGSPNYTFDYQEVTNNDMTLNLFEEIDNFSSSVGEIVSKGQYTFPQYSYFFKTGKSIRVKGYFTARGNDAKLQMRALIYNVTDSTSYTIARQNNGNNHKFANSGDVNGVPVNFEITYSCVEDENDGLHFQASGFYQYEYSSFNGGSDTNLSGVYVPIFNSTQFINVGTNDDEYKLYINFEDSTTDRMFLYHMTVEELS